MPASILVIDHGYSVAKVCLFEDETLRAFKVPLGFKASEHLSVLESLLYIIKVTEATSGIRIIDKDRKLAMPVYVSGEIASTQLAGVLEKLPIGTVDALREMPFNIVDVGSNFTFLKIADEEVLLESLRNGIVNREKVSATFSSNWLPFKISLGEVENYIKNKELYLQLVPVTGRELYLEQAIAREKLRQITDSFKEVVPFEQGYNLTQIVLSGGVLSLAPKYEQAFHIFLDGVNLPGVYRLFLDAEQIVICLGTLKRFDPDTAKGFVNSFNFVPLGTAICLDNLAARKGSVKVTIDVGLKNPQEMLVEIGDVLLFPLSSGEKAEVNLQKDNEEILSCEVEGGEVGVVIDARGRPLERPPFGSIGWQLLEKWDKQMNAHGQVGEI